MKTLISEIWVESPFASLHEPAFSNNPSVSKGWENSPAKLLRHQSRDWQASAVSKDLSWHSLRSGSTFVIRGTREQGAVKIA
jgi:hypothetical protein